MATKSLPDKVRTAAEVVGTVAYVGDKTVDVIKKSTPVRNGLVKAVDEKAANVIQDFILGDESQKPTGRRLPDVDIQNDSSSEYQMDC